MSESVDFSGKRVLVSAYGHVADTMAAVPALRSLRRAHPDARIDALVLKSVAPLLTDCPYVDEVIGWEDFRQKGRGLEKIEKTVLLSSLAVRLRPRRYHAVLVLHKATRALGLLPRLSGAEVRAGIGGAPGQYTHAATFAAGVESARDENRRVLRAIGVDEDGGPLEVWPTPRDVAWAHELVAGEARPLIGLHAGSDWSCQQWLPARFAEVGALLQEQTGGQIVLSGTSSEIGLQEEIASRLPRGPVRAAGLTTLGRLSALAAELDVLISVNSAAVALARAVTTPVVVLLGAEDRRFTDLADSATVRVIQPARAMAGGSWCEFGRWGVLSGCVSPMCRGIGGLDQLAVGPVVDATLELLADGSRMGAARTFARATVFGVETDGAALRTGWKRSPHPRCPQL